MCGLKPDFSSILRWTPIPNQSERTYYEVALKKYGNSTWNDILICREAQALSCDLTMFTLDLYYSYGYWARVRAVEDSQYSNWTNTRTRFTVDEVILTVGSVTLKLTNGIVYGTIHPPRPEIVPAGHEYEQIFKDHRIYSVSTRKSSEQKNTTMTVEQESFTLTVPRGMREFCVKVMPHVETRNNKAEWSEEQCLRVTTEQSTGLLVNLLSNPSVRCTCQNYYQSRTSGRLQEELPSSLESKDFTVTNLSILFTSILLLCGVLVCLVLLRYIRRPGKLPAVLDSGPWDSTPFTVFEKPHLFLLADPLCPETPDAIHILDLEAFPKVSPELRDSDLHGSTDSGFGSGKPSLQTEESQFLLPDSHPQIQGTLDKEEPPELQGTCGDNTDSGICLQEASSHTSMGPAWKQQLGYTHQDQGDSDVNLVQNSLGQPKYTQDGSALGHACLLEPKVPEEKDQVIVTFQGYQKQTRWEEEAADPAEPLDEDIPLTDAFDPELGMHLQDGLAWPPSALATGYLKQESQGMASAPPGTPRRQWNQLAEEWSLLGAISCEDLSLESWGFAHKLAPTLDCGAAPGGLLDSLGSNLVTVPLISSLQVEE
ncbi:Interleukin-10 receptor subunit alpha [Apodemus speciosus]|uniref:Interleukin-10 receptor subunit alpha n=1 Tax=Apodemus speciosus TaxID=105296 RepID=A0ABQ0F4F3_APOSI